MEWLTSKEITKLGKEGYSIQFLGRKLVEFESGNSKAVAIYYYVELTEPCFA